MLDLLYELLVEALENKAKPISELKWGEEISRLPVPGPFVPALLKTGQPPELPAVTPPAPPKPSEDGAAPAMVNTIHSSRKSFLYVLTKLFFELAGSLGCPTS